MIKLWSLKNAKKGFSMNPLIAYCTLVYMILKWKLYRKTMKIMNYSRALKVCINIHQNIPSLYIMQPGLKFNILGKAPEMQIRFHF